MRIRAFIYVGLGIVILGAWQFFVKASLDRSRAALNQQIVEAEAELADIRKTMSQLPVLLASQNSLRESKTRMQSSLYAKRDILAFLERVENLAQSRGLTLREITPPVEELLQLNSLAISPLDPQFLNISLQLDGSYLDFGRFVLALESAPFFRGINDCRISGSSGPVATINFTIGFLGLLGGSEAKG